MFDIEWGCGGLQNTCHIELWSLLSFSTFVQKTLLATCESNASCPRLLKCWRLDSIAIQVVQCPSINSAKVANPVIATLSFTFPSRLPTKKYPVKLKKLLMELIWFTHYMISFFTMDSMQPNIMLLSIKNGLGVWLLGSRVHCHCGIKREGIHGPSVYNTLLLLLHTSVKLPDLVLTFLHPNGQHNTNCCQ